MCSKGIYLNFGKRLQDILLSSVGIVVLFPILFIIGILVNIKLGRPIIFKQSRPGLNGKIFTLYKFRSMTESRDENGKLLPDSMRLTKFGKWLRRTSLDELPELINVLRGEMSIVGPRPLLVKYLPLYDEKQSCRHDVKPGITGYAQINGRNAISWEEKFDLDIWYNKHISLLLDWKIILSTIKAVFRQDGISSKSCETMESFTGTRQ